MDTSGSKKSVQFGYNSMVLEDDTATKSVKSAGSNRSAGLTRAKSVHIRSTENYKEKIETERKEQGAYVFLPWSTSYEWWFAFDVAWCIFAVFFEPYAVGFLPGGGSPRNNVASVFEYLITIVFFGDMLVNFNLAYSEGDTVILDRKKIAVRYFKGMFWVDFLATFPFYNVILAGRGLLGVNNQRTRYLQIIRLLRLLRMHRVMEVFAWIQYSSHINLFSLTLIRNFGTALIWSHFAACTLFFISRQSGFQDSWLEEPPVTDTNFDLYVTSLYWSVVTFATVGYGDFSPVNAAEQIFGIVYMFINMLLTSWIIGSITLLVVKNDEKNGEYRDTLELLNEYMTMHDFDPDFRKRLKGQLKLDFNSREVSDENVLKSFPNSLRRRVLRHLYLPALQETPLLKGTRQMFVDAFISSCSIEIHGPGAEIIQRGAIANDLYLLLTGTVKQTANNNIDTDTEKVDNNKSMGRGSVGESEYTSGGGRAIWEERESGDFINDIAFLTDSPSLVTIRCVSICKTLTMSKSMYKAIADDHPYSAGVILQNLLVKAKNLASKGGVIKGATPTKPLEALRAGSAFDFDPTGDGEIDRAMADAQSEAVVSVVEELVTMQINKQKDDMTTRFLFAASRSDMPMLRLMLHQGLDPNSYDYDRRNALMVAAMNGNLEVLSLLLENLCNPNLADVHGTSALYEAVKGGHDACMDLLFENGAKLCMSEEVSATKLCQCVFDGDIKQLTRLCKVGIDINAGDYDRRTPLHIAASEGNLTALKVLVEAGADLTVKDRWNNTIHDEAKRINSVKIIEYLKSIEK